MYSPRMVAGEVALKHDSQTSVFEHSTGFHNPEIPALLRALAAFSEKGKNL
jgi:hypothetical protein